MNAKHAKNMALRGSTVLVSAAAVAVAGGTAFAYWTTPASGSGSATAGAAQSLTGGVAAVVPATARLYPNSTPISGTVLITNPNPFHVQIDSVTWTGITVDAGHSAGCTTTGVTFAWSDAPGALKLARDNGTATLNYTVSMDNTSSSGCQGATFTGAFTLGAKSVTSVSP